jgi:hypothetical protein
MWVGVYYGVECDGGSSQTGYQGICRAEASLCWCHYKRVFSEHLYLFLRGLYISSTFHICIESHGGRDFNLKKKDRSYFCSCNFHPHISNENTLVLKLSMYTTIPHLLEFAGKGKEVGRI